MERKEWVWGSNLKQLFSSRGTAFQDFFLILKHYLNTGRQVKKENTSNNLLVAKYTQHTLNARYGAIDQQHNVLYGWVYLDLFYASTRDTPIHSHGPLFSHLFIAPTSITIIYSIATTTNTLSRKYRIIIFETIYKKKRTSR